MDHANLVIIGAGQAGLATAHVARRAGLRPIVLEAGEAAAGSWPHYYDSLTLFSPARYSSLPGRPFPGDRDRYPRRGEVADYLHAYAAELDADVRYRHRVQAVSSVNGRGFTVETDTGATITGDVVVSASGGFGRPHRPALAGLSDFGGTVLHAAEYRNPDQFAHARVVVVGGGNSAIQIAVELATVARVSVATRSGLRWAPQRPLGRDLHWWLTVTGLDVAPIGRLMRGRTAPVLDDGRYRAALATGNPDHRPMFTQLDADRVTWPDGTREHLDAIVLATGYRPHLDYLAGTGALDPDGNPLHRAGVSTTVPGLGYVGLEFQRSLASATLRGVARDARHVLRRLRPATAPPTRRPAALSRLRAVRGATVTRPVCSHRLMTVNFDNPDPHRLDKLRPEERAACLLAERILGVVAEEWDVQCRQGAVDAMLNYRDGRRAAFEVCKVAAEGALQTDSLLGRDDFTWPRAGQWWWEISVGSQRDIPQLRERYARIIAVCEAAGVTRPEQLAHRGRSLDPDIAWVVGSASTMWGYPDVPAVDGERVRDVMVVPAGRGGATDSTLARLRDTLARELASPLMEKHVDKLLATDADERHLYLPVHLSVWPFDVADAFQWSTSLPSDPPPLPEGITHLWLAPQAEQHVLWWAPDEWRRSPMRCEPTDED